MAKLYPPYIEGTLPAFCLENGGGTIVIPFALNKAVSKSEIGGIKAKIKTVQQDILLGDIACNLDLDKYQATIKVEDGEIPVETGSPIPVDIGQFYKIQLAFIDESTKEIGYYSTVGVTKCTSKPKVYIAKRDKEGHLVPLEANGVSNNTNEYVGVFEQGEGGDVTEKVYSRRFIITDLAGNEIVNTGDVLHNVENNPDSYWSYDILKFNRDFEFGRIYKIKYEVTTNNNLVDENGEKIASQ